MANQQALDRTFHALASPTRREIVSRLGRGRSAVKALAEPFDMALPSFMKHLDVLEEAGMVRSEKNGRERVYQLEPHPLLAAEHWMDSRRREWDTRLNQLDDFLKTQKENK
jgi:DNA-binding transcriptional ArsR family regulator